MFADAAARLAGVVGALLGWRPDDFWNATPEEVACVLSALSPPAEQSATAATLLQLKELFPDG